MDREVLGAPGGLRFELSFPMTDVSQDREWCRVKLPHGEVKTLRFHDYAEVFRHPGLYEAIFYEHLECSSPGVIGEELARQLQAANVSPATLRVLDLGAGNGLVSEELQKEYGIEQFLGVDIISEAAQAANRDRPNLYTGYVVADLTEPEGIRSLAVAVEDFRPNCLTCVAALGFGDIPARAFINAFNTLPDGGWLAFNLKSEFVRPETDKHGFARLVEQARAGGTMEVLSEREYPHRKDLAGKWLDYVAIIARKRGSL